MLSNTSKISICNRLEDQRSKQEEKNPEVANSSSVMAKARIASQKNHVCYIKATYSFIMKKRKQPQEQTTTKPINMQIPNSAFKIYSILKPVYPSNQLKKQERERKKKV